MIRSILTLLLLSQTVAFAATPNAKFATPAAFVENVGQVHFVDGEPASHVAATVRFGGVSGFLSSTGISMVYSKQHAVRDEFGDVDLSRDLLRVDRTYLGGNPKARIEFVNEQPGLHRFINGETGLQGAEAHRYNRVIIHEVWNGIDVHLRLTERGLKEDFIVHSGADVSQIAVQYVGADVVKVTNTNGVLMSNTFGSYTESSPVSFTRRPENR